MSNEYAINWTPIADAGEVRVGDVVSAEPGGPPTYWVVALDGMRAWIGGVRSQEALLMPLSDFRWRGHPTLS